MQRRGISPSQIRSMREWPKQLRIRSRRLTRMTCTRITSTSPSPSSTLRDPWAVRRPGPTSLSPHASLMMESTRKVKKTPRWRSASLNSRQPKKRARRSWKTRSWMKASITSRWAPAKQTRSTEARRIRSSWGAPSTKRRLIEGSQHCIIQMKLLLPISRIWLGLMMRMTQWKRHRFKQSEMTILSIMGRCRTGLAPSLTSTRGGATKPTLRITRTSPSRHPSRPTTTLSPPRGRGTAAWMDQPWTTILATTNPRENVPPTDADTCSSMAARRARRYRLEAKASFFIKVAESRRDWTLMWTCKN